MKFFKFVYEVYGGIIFTSKKKVVLLLAKKVDTLKE